MPPSKGRLVLGSILARDEVPLTARSAEEVVECSRVRAFARFWCDEVKRKSSQVKSSQVKSTAGFQSTFDRLPYGFLLFMNRLDLDLT